MTGPRVAHVASRDVTARFLLLGQLRRLRDEGFEVSAISAPGPWTPDLEEAGIRHIPWPYVTRAWDPRADVAAFGTLFGILRRERFDLVHTHAPKPGVMGRLAARIAGTPCIVNTVHGYYATPEDPLSRRAGVMAAEWLAARWSDLELFQSEEDLRWARRIGLVPPGRSRLLGNGVDLGRFDPAKVPPERVVSLRRELGIPEGALVVGTIGRVVAEKGYRELFRAARIVRDRFPDVRFVVVGSADPEKADSLGSGELARAPEGVILAGWRTDVPELLAAFDLFVLPSWREGLPRSPIEAAAMGLPLVLTDIRGCREVVRDGVEGLLVPPRDAGALAVAVSRLAADPELRTRMGEAAGTRARERFDEDRVTEIVLRSYRELLSRSGIPLPPHRRRIVLRPGRRDDAAALARLHRDALPGSFLPTLGEGFLRRLYVALVTDPSGVVVVAEEAGAVVGLIAAVESVSRFYRRFLVRHGVAAGLAAAPRLLRPEVLRKAFETARYAGNGDGLPEAEILSVALAPASRGRGTGKALVLGALERLGEMGVGEGKVIAGAELEAANRLYAGMGFTRVGTLAVHDGEASNVWVFPCHSSPRSASVSS